MNVKANDSNMLEVIPIIKLDRLLSYKLDENLDSEDQSKKAIQNKVKSLELLGLGNTHGFKQDASS